MPASVVIGQPNFSANSANQGGSARANTLANPYIAFCAGEKIIVNDFSNSRVLIWNKIPTENNVSADVVIGQKNFTESLQNQGFTATINTLNLPDGVFSDGQKLFIADGANHRVLIYNSIPTTNNVGADVVIGQTSFTGQTANQGGSVGANTLSSPIDVWVDEGKLFIADDGNHRVLIFNQIPTTHNASADIVVGQQNFTSNSANQGLGSPGPNTLWFPAGVTTYRGKLIISEINTGGNGNKRVLIFNSIPSTNNASADVVVGQPDFGSNSANQGGTAKANTIVGTRHSWVANGRLFIPEEQGSGNNRVLVYNTIPTVNNALADMVLGQKDFISGTANQGGTPNASTLNRPTGGSFCGDKLFVADRINSRVLIYSNQVADLSLSKKVSGQPDGLLRFSGTAKSSTINGIVKKIEYVVNGGNWIGGFAEDGKFDSSLENYYFDFNPTINTMAGDNGFVVKIRSTHDNDLDTSKSTIYFEPFVPLAPIHNTFTRNRLPSFSFAIQKERFSDLKDSLDHFRISLAKDGSGFSPYIDFIPVDYDSVRMHPDNLKPNIIATMSGTYEDTSKNVRYEQDNSFITVQSKANNELKDGTYQWKVEAIDRSGNIQETQTRILRVGSRQVITSRQFFPLVITGVGGKNGNVHLSTEYSHTIAQPVSVESRWPTFAGIATRDATVTFAIRDLNCPSDLLSCTKLYQTVVGEDSRFRKTIPKALQSGMVYDVTVSVKDSGDNYNELESFQIQIPS